MQQPLGCQGGYVRDDQPKVHGVVSDEQAIVRVGCVKFFSYLARVSGSEVSVGRASILFIRYQVNW